MIPTANVSVEIDEQAIKQYIQSELDKSIHQNLLFIDINKLVEITSCSKRWLEEELLQDPRIKVCERRKNRKRLWLYPDVAKAIKAIADEW